MTDQPPQVQGLDTRPFNAVTAVRPPPVAPMISTRSDISDTTDFLLDNVRIGYDFQHHMRYRRYVDLRRNEMFESLVRLYTQIFSFYWQQLRRFMDGYPPPAHYDGNPQRYAAAVYISTWFLDLYVTNRESCCKLSDAAYNEIYHMDIVHRSTEYDPYLVKLLAAIRPTNIRFNHEDTLFIPRHDVFNLEPQGENYFNIQGWVIHDSVFFGIYHILRDRKLVKFEAITSNSTGRASWLFDWHADDHAYSWFTPESNYSTDDITIAYILGVACTPKLGPRDYDEWQLYPGNVFPANVIIANYHRVRPIAYHGAYEKRIIESDRWKIPDPLFNLLTLEATPATANIPAGTSTAAAPPAQQRPKRGRPAAQTRHQLRIGHRATDYSQQSLSSQRADHTEQEAESSATGQPAATDVPAPVNIPGPDNMIYTVAAPHVARYRIVDYLYHARVVLNNDIHSRQAALRMMIRP
uniref:Coat protein n=1 Tax=Dactylorhiza hatagirea deltapartitivirus TaxID=2765858 RepID=A0A8D9UJ73_9VIRU|nr:TPA_exp: coat protein [Dactylorhiza hatagirea deltapartitivirus]